MEKTKFVKAMAYLGTFYNKEFTENEVSNYYEFLGGFDYNILMNANKKLISTKEFLPKVSEIIQECRSQEFKLRLAIVQYMNEKGKFHKKSSSNKITEINREYEKTLILIRYHDLPSWLSKMLRENYEEMLKESSKPALTNSSYLIECNENNG